MAIKVIGLGMGRTGTSSLKLALEQLGFGACYHMEDLIDQPEKVRHWKEIERYGDTSWDVLFKGYQSVVDFPVIAYYKAVIRAFPEAKVILTIREEESWYRSAIATILNPEPPLLEKVKMGLQLPFSRHKRDLMKVFQLSKQFWIEHIGSDYRNKEKAIRFYRQWNKQVMQEMPAENLLVYNVADGWPALCDFLGTPIPDKPFFKTNSRKEFKRKNKNRS